MSVGIRPTQADRSARTRGALLESAARGLSRYGYGNLALAEVAREAGYTRGALYHQFKDKEDLALSVIEWAFDTWRRRWASIGSTSNSAITGARCSPWRGVTRSTAGATSPAW